MLRKESEAIPEGNGPVPHQKEFRSGQPTLVDVYQKIEDVWDMKMDEITRHLEHHLTSLEQDARHPRLAMEADGPADAKTRERKEGAATTVQAMHRDSFSASRVDPGPKTNSTSFGSKAGSPSFPCRNGVLPSSEMRSPTAAGGLLPTGEATIATTTTYNPPPLWFYATEEMVTKKSILRTQILYVLYDSNFWPSASFCRRVIETKSGENRMFDPGGSRSSPRRPVLGTVASVALWGGSC